MMKTTEQKRAQAQRIVNLIDTRGDWVIAYIALPSTSSNITPI